MNNLIVKGKLKVPDENYMGTTLEQNLTPSQANLWKFYDKIYILTKKKNEYLPKEMFLPLIDKSVWEENKSKLFVYSIDKLNLVKNPIFFDKMITLNKDFLEQFDNFGEDFLEENLVLPLLSVSVKDLGAFLCQFDGSINLTNFFKIRILNQYYENRENKQMIHMKLIEILNSLEETKYWTYYHNTQLNTTSAFKNRRFKLHLFKDTKDKKMMDKIYKLKNFDSDSDPYLTMIFNTQNRDFVDGLTSYKPRFKLYKVLKKDCGFTKEDINNMYYSLNGDEIKYYFLSNLLISKKYCHLIMTNGTLMDSASNIFYENAFMFRYLFSYAWYTLYLEECSWKTFATNEHRFIFSLSDANKHLDFPFIHKNPGLNPYFQTTVSFGTLNSHINFKGLNCYSNKICKRSLASQEKFNYNFNLFITGNSKYNLIKGIDWSKYAACGSGFDACIQDNHPLLTLFQGIAAFYTGSDQENQDNIFLRFLKEYYSNSDADFMVNSETVMDFISDCTDFYQVVCKNLTKMNSSSLEEIKKHTKLNPVKNVLIVFNLEYLKNFLKNKDIDLNDFIQNMDTNKYNYLFYPEYIKWKKKYTNNYLKDFTVSERKAISVKYKDNFSFCDVEDIKFMLVHNKKQINEIKSSSIKFDDEMIKKLLQEEADDHLMYQSDEEESSDILFDIKEGIKYHIDGPFLNRKFELFRLKYLNSWWSCLYRFHLPCVRGYFDGKNTYLSPSCLSAQKTFQNIDFRYFSGKKPPMEVLLKNLMRGKGIYLNTNELSIMTKYISEDKFWNNLFEINYKNVGLTRKKFLNGFSLQSKLFRPRFYNPESDKFDFNNVYVDSWDQYNECIIDNNKIINSLESFREEMIKRFNCYVPKNDLLTYTLVNPKTGKVNPVKKWLITAYWENKKLSK